MVCRQCGSGAQRLAQACPQLMGRDTSDGTLGRSGRIPARTFWRPRSLSDRDPPARRRGGDGPRSYAAAHAPVRARRLGRCEALRKVTCGRGAIDGPSSLDAVREYPNTLPGTDESAPSIERPAVLARRAPEVKSVIRGPASSRRGRITSRSSQPHRRARFRLAERARARLRSRPPRKQADFAAGAIRYERSALPARMTP